jgi:ribosomal-protein-alanine N-acetyltransferase
MQIPILETSQLLLRPFTPEDAGPLNLILHEEGILRYFPDSTPPSPRETQNSIARRLEHWAKYGYGRWAVVTPEDGLLVGWNGLDYLSDFDEAEVTYLLSTRVWGRGYASEAARAAVRFAFGSVGLDHIMSMASPDNIASNRVLQKCGLRFAEHITVEGKPMLRYRLQRSEYESTAAD